MIKKIFLSIIASLAVASSAFGWSEWRPLYSTDGEGLIGYFRLENDYIDATHFRHQFQLQNIYGSISMVLYCNGKAIGSILTDAPITTVHLDDTTPGANFQFFATR